MEPCMYIVQIVSPPTCYVYKCTHGSISNLICALATKAPITEVASSGAELPAAMKVAPATSGLRPRAETGYGIIIEYYLVQLQFCTSIWKPLTVGYSGEWRNEVIFANYCKPWKHRKCNIWSVLWEFLFVQYRFDFWMNTVPGLQERGRGRKF